MNIFMRVPFGVSWMNPLIVRHPDRVPDALEPLRGRCEAVGSGRLEGISRRPERRDLRLPVRVRLADRGNRGEERPIERMEVAQVTELRRLHLAHLCA